MSSFMPIILIGIGTVVAIVFVWFILYEDEIRGGFGWLGAKVILLGAAMLGLWILAIVLVVSKLVGAEKKIIEVDAERDEKRETD